ncbi:MAG: tetratricopeptide repeat protein [Armatimonadota bacterium]
MSMRYRALFAIVFTVSVTVGLLAPSTTQELPADLLQRGSQARQQGDWEEALQHYRQFLQQNPNHEAAVLAHFAAGECLYRLNRYEEAEREYRTVFENYPNWSDVSAAYLRAGTALFNLQRYEKSAETLRAALEKFESSPIGGTLAYWLGESLYQQGKVKAAISAYQRSLELSPDGELAPYALYSIATTYSETDAEKALETFAELQRRFPDIELQAEAIYRTGKLHEQQANYSEALSSYETVLEEFPDSEFAPRAMLGFASVYYRRGEFARAAGEFEKVAQEYAGSRLAVQASLRAGDAWYAAGEYERAAEIYMTVAESDVSDIASSAAYWGAVSYQLTGKGSEAVEALENLAQAYPNHPEIADACIRLGGLYLDRGDFEKALAAYRQAGQKATEDDEQLRARFGELWTLHQKEGSAERLEALETLLLKHPESALTRNNALFVANLQMSAGDFAGALQLAQVILDHHPDHPGSAEALTTVGQAHRKLNNSDAAHEALTGVLGEYSDTASADVARSELAFMRLEEGKLQEAATLIETISPDSAAAEALPRLHYRLGQGYADAESWQSAITACEKAYELAPEGEWADAALMGIADAQVADNQLLNALENYRAFIEHFADSAEVGRAHLRVGEVLVRLKRHEQAVEYYTEVLQNNHDAEWAPEVAFALGETYADDRQMVRAVEAFVDVADSYPKSDLAPDALFTAAELRYDQSNFSAASRLYERLLDEYPESRLVDETHYKLGWSLLKMQERAAALEHFLVTLDGSDNRAVAADARLQAGYIYMHNDRYEDAIEVLKPALQSRPVDQLPSILHLLAEAYISADRLAEAVDLLERLIGDFPEYSYVQQGRLRLAQTYADLDRDEKAEALLNTLREADNREIADKAALELAEIKRGREQLDEALQLYLSVADGAEDDELAAHALYRAARTSQRLGNQKQATEMYRRLLNDYPEENPWAERAQRRLDRLTEKQEED